MKYYVIKQGLCSCCNYFDPDKDKREAVGLFILDRDEYILAQKRGLDLCGLSFWTKEDNVFTYKLEFTDRVGRSFFSRILETKINVFQSGRNSSRLFLEEVTEAQYETYETFGMEEFETVEKLDLALELIRDSS